MTRRWYQALLPAEGAEDVTAHLAASEIAERGRLVTACGVVGVVGRLSADFMLECRACRAAAGDPDGGSQWTVRQADVIHGGVLVAHVRLTRGVPSVIQRLIRDYCEWRVYPRSASPAGESINCLACLAARKEPSR